jgi:hypothetical protein
MGWWKIKDVESGQVDHNWESAGTLLTNAIPGRDSPENYYNGDDPADLLVKWLGIATRGLKKFDMEPTPDLLASLWWEGGEYFASDNAKAWKYFDRLHRWVWAWMRRIYRNAWGRRPYEEESTAVFNFVLNAHFRHN